MNNKPEIIGIITAMSCEAETIRPLLTDIKKEKIGYGEFISGKLGNTWVVLSVCGVGKVFAGVCTSIMIVNFGCTHIFNIGVAGALTQDLDIGDTVCASATVEYDMDTSAAGDLVGLISGINVVEMPCHEQTLGQIESFFLTKGISLKKGIIASGDRFLKGADERLPLAEQFGACAGEMEGAAVGQICYANSVPYNVLRIITDKADPDVGQQYTDNLEKCASMLALNFAEYICSRDN